MMRRWKLARPMIEAASAPSSPVATITVTSAPSSSSLSSDVSPSNERIRHRGCRRSSPSPFGTASNARKRAPCQGRSATGSRIAAARSSRAMIREARSGELG